MKKSVIIAIFGILVNLCLVFDTYAADNVRVIDETGTEVEIDESGTCVTSSDTIFDFKSIKGEIIAVKNGDKKNPIELKDHLFVAKSGEDMDLSFFIVDHNKKIYTLVPDLPEICKLRKTTLKDMTPAAELIYDGVADEGGIKIVHGGEVKLRIKGQMGIRTYAKITDEDEAYKYSIDSDGKDFRLEDGRYSIKVWSEDGKGNIYNTSLPFDSFIVDSNAPSAPQIELTGKAKTLEKNNYIVSDKPLIYNFSSKDNTSGVKKYVCEFDDGRKTEGDTLEINNGFNGSFSVWAEDFAGNASEKTYYKNVIVDAEKPEVKLTYDNISNEKLEISAEAKDTISGIEYLEAFWDGEKKKKNNDRKLNISIDLAAQKEGIHELKLSAADRAGNSSEKSYEINIEKTQSPTEKILANNKQTMKKELPDFHKLPSIPSLLGLNKKFLKSLRMNLPNNALNDDYANGKIEMTLNGEEFFGGSVKKPGHYVLTIRSKGSDGKTNEKKAEFIIR